MPRSAASEIAPISSLRRTPGSPAAVGMPTWWHQGVRMRLESRALSPVTALRAWPGTATAARRLPDRRFCLVGDTSASDTARKRRQPHRSLPFRCLLGGQPERAALVDRVELVAADGAGRAVDDVPHRLDRVGLEEADAAGAVRAG